MQRVDSGGVIDAERQPGAVALTRQAGADLVSLGAARPVSTQTVTKRYIVP